MSRNGRACLHQLLETQAALRPAAIAVVCGDEQLTYAELNGRANQLARLLAAEARVQPGTLVALCAQRSVELVVSIFAILKAGGAYVPLASTYPRERQAFMLQDCGAPLLLVQKGLQSALPQFAGVTLTLEDLAAQRARYEPSNPEFAISETDVAYVIYTSGSTGTPKGVLVEHRGTYNTAVTHIELCGGAARRSSTAVCRVQLRYFDPRDADGAGRRGNAGAGAAGAAAGGRVAGAPHQPQ